MANSVECLYLCAGPKKCALQEMIEHEKVPGEAILTFQRYTQCPKRSELAKKYPWWQQFISPPTPR